LSQFLTPYPKTRLRQELLEADLVANEDDFRTYDGFHCNVRTRHLDQDALSRGLKRESLKAYFDPNIYARNFFLRHHPRAFFTAFARAMVSILAMVLRGPQPAERLDV
jgi:hypothetical protein